jgi:hypothetical protein
MKTVRLFPALFGLLLLSSNIEAQQLGQRVYWMAVTQVSIGQLSEYHAFAEKEMNPLMEEHGYLIIATWQTIVGEIEEVVMVAEFESMAAYHKARVSLITSEEWQKVSIRFGDMTKGINSRFLSGTPYSKIK